MMFEFEKILDHEEGTKVPLDVGLEIVPVGAVRFLSLSLHPGKESLEEKLVSILLRRRRVQFLDAEGQKGKKGGPSRQRLGYGLAKP